MPKRIAIVATDGETMELDVEPTDTVLSVKQKIHGRWHFAAVHRQKLNIPGLKLPWLDDEATLAQYGIAKAINTITLFVGDDGSAGAGASASAGAGFGAGTGASACFGAGADVGCDGGVSGDAGKATTGTEKTQSLGTIPAGSPRGPG